MKKLALRIFLILSILKSGWSLYDEKRNHLVNKNNQNGNQIQLICYYASWSRNRQMAKLEPESIDPHLCTHIIYAFAKIQNGKIVPFEKLLEEDFYQNIGYYTRINNLKKINPSLKVLLSIGSYDLSGELKHILYNNQKRKYFISNAVEFIKKYGFDGIDFCYDEKKFY